MLEQIGFELISRIIILGFMFGVVYLIVLGLSEKNKFEKEE